ncbi:MAG TPA: hypothetical protein VG962_08780 [Steroidobacteraceae bacterium]|nr:hypothetical protein [Steroidobacteraceae bacterium]
MIINLPKQFPIDALEKFEFGDVEAQLDPLLFSCPVPTTAIDDFLSDKKDIVLGYRGAGKSAIVRLLNEEKLSFKHEEEWQPIILCLDEEFSFQLISDALNRRAEDPKNQKLICRVIWEILLIYRALQEIKRSLGHQDQTLNTYLAELESALGVPGKKPGLVEILLTSKKKIGIKIDTNLPNVIDMYAGLEPNPQPDEDNKPITLKLIEYKRHLNRLLHEEKRTLYVLFDRLDDFVAREDYDTQRHLLHGLLATQTDYRQKYPRIKIKAFIRSDLFIKLDLSEFGPDKILARTVSLKWSPGDIKKFIAKRIAYNLIQYLELDALIFEFDSDQCRVSRDQLAMLKETKKSMVATSKWNWKFWHGKYTLRRLFRRSSDAEGRLRNFSEVINEAIITSILPTEVIHLLSNGNEAPIGIFEYFDSHFQFGHGETTPRAMLGFLNHFLTSVRKYYAENPDIEYVAKNQNGEYPLFVKRAVQEAYDAHRREAWEVQLNWAHPWKPLIATAKRMSKKTRFSYRNFVSLAKVSEEEARQFLAFCTHTGLVRCINDRERTENREYEFPILFQTVESNSRRP